MVRFIIIVATALFLSGCVYTDVTAPEWEEPAYVES